MNITKFNINTNYTLVLLPLMFDFRATLLIVTSKSIYYYYESFLVSYAFNIPLLYFILSKSVCLVQQLLRYIKLNMLGLPRSYSASFTFTYGQNMF
uniref:Uncharacterized protein n=1 Tax=Lepeophtheirus salmonis TaxID=72036 RepID=A0A0K2TUH8_LEPSM